MSVVYKWFTEASWRSWYAHALASCAMAYLPVAAYRLSARFGLWPEHYYIDPQSLACFTATGALGYYIGKEMGDELKHRRAGEWNKRANIDKVSWASDGKADLVGPFTVWLTTVVAWLV